MGRVALALGVLVAASLIASGQTDNGALNKDDVKKTVSFMKQTNSSDAEIAGVISRAGVDFKATAADERELRQAGASEEVIQAVRGSYRGPAQPDDPPREDKAPPKDDKAPPKDETAAKTGDARKARDDASLTDNTANQNNNGAEAGATNTRDQRRRNNNQQTTQQTAIANENQPQNPAQTAQFPTAPDRQQNPAGLTADQKLLIFKVGDRVDVDPSQYLPPNKRWYPGTVVKVNTNALGDVLDYDVQMDTVDGSEVISQHIPRRPNWIRASSAAAIVQGDQGNRSENRAAPPRNTARNNQNQENGNHPTPPQDNRNPDGVTFQLGDRVEVDVTQMMPPNKKWYKAIIVKVNRTSLGDILDYDVKLDTTDGSEIIRDHIPKRANWIRPAQ